MTKWTIDILPLKVYYSTMKEKAVTAKKNPRPELTKPRKVVINPKPAKENVIHTENLVSLVDMLEAEDYVLSRSDDDTFFALQERDETGSDSITKYGLFLGYANNKAFIPEVVIDEKGAYVLIFHDITK